MNPGYAKFTSTQCSSITFALSLFIQFDCIYEELCVHLIISRARRSLLSHRLRPYNILLVLTACPTDSITFLLSTVHFVGKIYKFEPTLTSITTSISNVCGVFGLVCSVRFWIHFDDRTLRLNECVNTEGLLSLWNSEV